MTTNRGALAMLAAVLMAVGTGAAWHLGGPVEPRLRDRWRSVAEGPGGQSREDVMDVSRSGEVHLERRWRSQGTFETFENAWRLVTGDGTVHAGTWVQPAAGRVRFAGGFPFEIDTWVREVLPQGGGPLAGRWRAAGEDPAGGVAAFVVDPDGHYRYARATNERAVLAASNGIWRVSLAPGGLQEGTYRIDPDGVLIVSIDGGDVRWIRD